MGHTLEGIGGVRLERLVLLLAFSFAPGLPNLFFFIIGLVIVCSCAHKVLLF
jgi:hypothetical protein